VRLRTAIRTLVALNNAPQVKEILRREQKACHRHKKWCTCKPDELCNIALAEFLEINPSSALRGWRSLMKDLEDINAVSTRIAQEYLDGELPPYRPHRFVRLTKSVENVLGELLVLEITEFEKRQRRGYSSGSSE